jgi:hypothetical protein
MRAVGSIRAAQSAGSPRFAAPQASNVFSEQILKRRIIKHRFGQQLLEPAVLIFQGLQPPRLRDLQPSGEIGRSFLTRVTDCRFHERSCSALKSSTCRGVTPDMSTIVNGTPMNGRADRSFTFPRSKC